MTDLSCETLELYNEEHSKFLFYVYIHSRQLLSLKRRVVKGKCNRFSVFFF